MNIALDYDGTYTEDKTTWDYVIALLRSAGHNVIIVTMRNLNEEQEFMEVHNDLVGKVNCMYFTNRKQKRKYMESQGIYIDVWIDDMPEAIVDSKTFFS